MTSGFPALHRAKWPGISKSSASPPGKLGLLKWCQGEDAEMDLELIIGGLIAFFLLIYLVYALLRAEEL